MPLGNRRPRFRHHRRRRPGGIRRRAREQSRAHSGRVKLERSGGATPEGFHHGARCALTRARLQMGERVPVHAARRGVGTAAIQLAHACAARRSTAHRARPTNSKRVRALGLDGDNHSARHAASSCRGVRKRPSMPASKSFSISLEATISPPISRRSRRRAAPSASGQPLAVDLKSISVLSCGSGATIVGTVLATRGRPEEKRAEATRRFKHPARPAAPLSRAPRGRPVVDRVYPRRKCGAAHRCSRSSRNCRRSSSAFRV